MMVVPLDASAVKKPKQTKPMEYMLIFTESAADYAKRDNPAEMQSYWGAWGAYVNAIEQAGITVTGRGLLPPDTATTVRVRDGQRQVHDGPYAEAKEMISGFFIINVPDLDTALEWAARSPSSSYSSTEVRPVMPPMAP